MRSPDLFHPLEAGGVSLLKERKWQMKIFWVQ
jgi:hypothetical protein